MAQEFWAVYRFRREIRTPQEALPLVTYPALPASNFFLAQDAKRALARQTGLRLYVDLGEEEA